MNPTWHQRAIALTGAPGSGKSTAAAILHGLGAFVIDADSLAKEAVMPGSAGLSAIVQEFGGEILCQDGSLDRKKMGCLVFNDASRRAALEAIIHPIVRALAEERFKKAFLENHPLYVYDCPLLFETGLNNAGFQKIMVIAADPGLCLARTMNRDGINEKAAKLRIASQFPLEKKTKKADIVVDNSGTLEELEVELKDVFTKLTLQE